MIKTNREL